MDLLNQFNRSQEKTIGIPGCLSSFSGLTVASDMRSANFVYMFCICVRC